MGCADRGMLVALALDGELDAAGIAELDQHLAECPDCAIEHARLKALKAALKANLPREAAPAGLRERILAALPEDAGSTVAPLPRFRRIGWPAALGTALGAALAASLATFLLVRPTAEDRMTDEIVASQMRAQVSGHLTDLAASDPATVKPWLTGRIDMAPPVKDLSKLGFELAGARVDYVGGQRTAALVYREGPHVVTLYVLNTPGAPAGDSDAVQRQGYAVCHWTKSGLTFWAIADVDPEELEHFEDLVTRTG